MAAAAALTAAAAGFVLFLCRFVLSFSHFGFPVESVRRSAAPALPAKEARTMPPLRQIWFSSYMGMTRPFFKTAET